MRLNLAVFGILACLAGCAAPPSAAEFADATVGLRSAVKASGTTLERTIRESDLQSSAANADTVRTAWLRRNAVMDQAVAYAEGLQAIAEAAQKSTETVQALAGKVQGIAGAAGLVMPAQSVIDVATTGVAWVFRQINNAKGAKTMEESLKATDAAIQGIAEILAADRQHLDDLFKIEFANKKNALESSARYKDMPLALSNTEQTIVGINVKTASEEDLMKLQALNARADSLHAQLGQMNDQIEAERADFKLQTRLLDAFGEALAAWSAAHHQLIRAVQDSRRLSATALIEATEELRVIVRRINEL